jgi:erythromycin esterase-like protein
MLPMLPEPASARRACALLPLAVLCVLALYAVPARAQGAGAGSATEQAVDAVCGKRVVMLGELPSHGEARGFQEKARIVERLVGRCGFRAVLFEAPMYDFVGFQKAVDEGTAAQPQLDRSIGRFWWTRELAGWHGWLFREASAGRLVLGGLDDQVSATSEYARATLPGLVAASLSARDASECGEAVARNLGWRYDGRQQFDEAERVRLRRCASLAATARAGGGRAAETPERAMLESLAGYFARQQDTAAGPDRDLAMYRNFAWQMKRLPRGTKVIVWTATVHAARRQGPLPREPLGARIAGRWGDRVGVIGFSALAGQSSMAGRPGRPLPELPPGSLEVRAARPDTAWAYVDRTALRRIGSVPSRLLGGFAPADWWRYFDGVLVIREEAAPIFEQWR